VRDGSEDRARPPGGDGGIAGEVVQLQGAEHAEVVVADQALARVRPRPGAALVRLRAVADEVAEAPDLVGRFPPDRLGRRLEGGEVSVDV